jgi:hypothetical protein
MLVVDESIVIVDQEELPVAAEPRLEHVDRIDQVERKPLDRRQGDPRNACGHDYNVSCVL